MMTPTWSDPDLRHRLAAIRMCALDVDGTLLNSRHEISPETREAVHAAQAAGLEVLLASSRGPSAMRPVLDALDAPAGSSFVASHGAVVGSLDGAGQLRVTAQRPLPLGDGLAVLRLARALGLSVGWYSGSSWLVDALDPAIAVEASITRCSPTVTDLSRQATGPDKLMLIAPPGEVHLLTLVVEHLGPNLHGQISNPTYLEITATGVDKASAITAYRQDLGFESHHVLAMGDGPNDLGMFAVAGLSVAPANARPQVLEAADAVSPANDDDGVAWVLTQLIASGRELTSGPQAGRAHD